jgi:hypothetical protein
MAVGFPNVRVGTPVRHRMLSVFPLFDGGQAPVEYVLSQEGIGAGCVTVSEVSESGSVPDLLVENKGDVRVLFLEGEQLVGAKQNRVLNTSVLVPAHSRIKVPVSCVEQGRWGYKSRHFGSSGTSSPSKLRFTLKASVARSLANKEGHRADQHEVWNEVARQQTSLGASSGTHAMADTFAAHDGSVKEFHENLKYVEGATGLAVAIGGKIVAVDMFDKPGTCRKVWERLMSGYVLDALEAKAVKRLAGVGAVERLLKSAGALAWERSDTIGEGTEFRAHEGETVHGSALTFGEAMVHGSLAVGG